MANRIITVGAESRAIIISTFLDETPAATTYRSGRGFTTITGYYKQIKISIVAIGMVNKFRESIKLVDSNVFYRDHL